MLVNRWTERPEHTVGGCASMPEKLSPSNDKRIIYLVPEFEPFPKADVKIRFGKISVPAKAEGENEWELKSSR